MTAKHRPSQPKRHRSTSELERRVRWLERHAKRDAVSIATHIARVEVDHAVREHIQDKHPDPGWWDRFLKHQSKTEVDEHAPPN